MHIRLGLLLIVLLGLQIDAEAQIKRIDPPHWWVNMHHDELQLMIHGEQVGSYEVSIQEDGVSLLGVHRAKSLNYLFVDLRITAQQAKTITLVLEKEGSRVAQSYELKARTHSAESIRGFDASDALFLLTPDRFANGDPENDYFDSLRAPLPNREDDYGRHGGDIRGIINGLEYIDALGFTAIWPGPMLINDMPEQSYHGYAITDHYRVDPRFGTVEEYQELSDQMRKRGMKLVMDQINNHCGSLHWWMDDLPFDDWLNGQANYLEKQEIAYASHRRTTLQDPYATKKDLEAMTEGWFVSTMPDLNHRNPYLARYIIQNSIWWIETLGLGGIRQDTQPYNDPAFMSQWAGTIMEAYPHFSIVGEEWSYNPMRIAYWQEGHQNSDGYQSNMNAVFDFPLQGALSASLKEDEGWDTGLIKWYEALSNDFIYPDPNALVFMADNHDMDRLFTQLDEDLSLHKMALALLAVSPRTPQLYYGTEILMQNTAKPHDHGLIRTDFPGGWKGDKVNAFTGEGLTQEQLEVQTLTRKLFNYRKKSSELADGRTLHYAPAEGVYVLSRYTSNKRVTLFINKAATTSELSLEDYEELSLRPGQSLYDIVNETHFKASTHFQLAPRSFLLIESSDENY